ncbi:MAG: hypothetical protein WBD31_19405 [Rubripirellula sp.]
MSRLNSQYSRLVRVIALAAIFSTSVSNALGQSTPFCVTVKTFSGAALEPSAEHRIVFDNGLVYDLPQIDPSTVTLYDPAQGRVTLLDRPRQVQTTISIDDLINVTAQARAAAEADEQKKEQLGLNARVQTSNRMVGYSIQFGGATYHTSTQKPSNPAMAADFGQLSDLAARLNLVRRHPLPPFARMTLNDRVTSAGEIPLETTLTLKRGDQTDEYRSTMAIGEVTEADKTAMIEIQGMAGLYKNVPLAEFPSE